jgi:hypothetical protein
MRLPLHLELDQGELKGLQVSVDPFVGPDGALAPVTVTLNGASSQTPIDIKQYATLLSKLQPEPATNRNCHSQQQPGLARNQDIAP